MKNLLEICKQHQEATEKLHRFIDSYGYVKVVGGVEIKSFNPFLEDKLMLHTTMGSMGLGGNRLVRHISLNSL